MTMQPTLIDWNELKEKTSEKFVETVKENLDGFEVLAVDYTQSGYSYMMWVVTKEQCHGIDSEKGFEFYYNNFDKEEINVKSVDMYMCNILVRIRNEQKKEKAAQKGQQ